MKFFRILFNSVPFIILFSLSSLAIGSAPVEEEIADQTIDATAETGFYIEPFAEFGQSFPTNDESPRPSYGFGLNLGFFQVSNLWTRLEPSFEIFSKTLNAANQQAIIPVGGMLKIAYAYRIGPGLYVGPALGAGIGIGSYAEGRSDIKYESNSSVPAQVVTGQFLIDFIGSDTFSFRTGLKVSHFLLSIEEIESETSTIQLFESTRFNCFELVFGLKLRFSA